MSTDEQDMVAFRMELCGRAERIAKNVKLTLDYSEQSVDRIEGILAAIHEDYKKTCSERGIKSAALYFAAYLITILERLDGPVVWQRDHAVFGEETFPVEWRGVHYFLMDGA